MASLDASALQTQTLIATSTQTLLLPWERSRSGTCAAALAGAVVVDQAVAIRINRRMSEVPLR